VIGQTGEKKYMYQHIVPDNANHHQTSLKNYNPRLDDSNTGPQAID